MNINLSIYEVMDLLSEGSTAQKEFLRDISESGNSFRDVLEVLEELQEEEELTFDLRGDINGGVLRFEEVTEYIKGNYLFIEFENGYGLVFY